MPRGYLVAAEALTVYLALSDTDGLGLETVGVTARRNGTIPVDDFCNTTAEGVYALGDVIGSGFDLTPVAIAAGGCGRSACMPPTCSLTTASVQAAAWLTACSAA